MKKNILFSLIISICLLGFISCGNVKADEHGLYNNIEDAIQVAQKNNQDILVVITLDGEDYISTDLINNVLFTEEFKNDVASKYAVVHIDFGQSTYEKTIVDETASKKEQKKTRKFAELMQENTIFASQLNVNMTPSFFLLTKDEYYIATMDYTIVDSVQTFKDLLAVYEPTVNDIHAMVEKINNGSDVEKMAAIDELYEATPAEYKQFLYDLIEQILKLDKENQNNYYSKYILLKADIDAILLYQEGDVLGASKKYIEVVSDKYMTPEQVQQAYYMAAYLLSIGGTNEYEAVIQYLRKAIDVAPDTNAVPHITTVLSSIESIVQNGLEHTIEKE